MKKNLQIILIYILSTLTINAEHSLILLEKIEKELSCTKQYTKDKDKDKNNKLEECIKRMIEIKINENYKDKEGRVQLFVFSKEEEAKKQVKKYNIEKRKISNLKKTKADYIVKNFKGHKRLKDGKYYIVFVTEKGVSTKKLQEKIRKEGKNKSVISYKSKIIIDIDNKIVKDMHDARVKILNQKANCYKNYPKTKELNKLMKCLKKEAITAIQIHALPNNDFCEKAKKDCKVRKCECIKKKVGDETYYTVVEIIESSKKDTIKKIKQKKSNPFKLKKPEISIK